MDKARKSMGDISRAKTAKREPSPTVEKMNEDMIKRELSFQNKKYFTQQFKGLLPLEKQKLVAFYQNINPCQVNQLFRSMATTKSKNKAEILNHKFTRKIPFLKLYGKIKENSQLSTFQNRMKETVNDYYEAIHSNEAESIPMPSQRYEHTQCDSFGDEIITSSDKNTRKSMISLDSRRNPVEIENQREKLNNSAMLQNHQIQINEDHQLKTIQSKYESTIRSEPVTATTVDSSVYLKLK